MIHQTHFIVGSLKVLFIMSTIAIRGIKPNTRITIHSTPPGIPIRKNEFIIKGFSKPKINKLYFFSLLTQNPKTAAVKNINKL